MTTCSDQNILGTDLPHIVFPVTWHCTHSCLKKLHLTIFNIFFIEKQSFVGNLLEQSDHKLNFHTTFSSGIQFHPNMLVDLGD